MSGQPARPPSPSRGGPRVPPPPAGTAGPRQKATDLRWLGWSGAFAVGIALGIGAYHYLPEVDAYVDYWLALALG